MPSTYSPDRLTLLAGGIRDGGSPERIGAAHPPNEIPHFRPNRGPTPSVSTLPCPVAPEALTMPPHHCLGPHHLQRTPPVLPQPRQHDPEEPVRRRQSVGAAGAPSTRRLVVGVRGSPAPTPAACESWTAVSERGSQAISPYPVNSGSVSPTARQSRRTSFQEGLDVATLRRLIDRARAAGARPPVRAVGGVNRGRVPRTGDFALVESKPTRPNLTRACE